MSWATLRFRFWLLGVLAAVVLAGAVVAGWRASPAMALIEDSHSGRDERAILELTPWTFSYYFHEFDGPLEPPPPWEESLGEDELGLLPYASAYRELGLDRQEWGVWICEFPEDHPAHFSLDFQSVLQSLHAEITPFLEWLSDGHYSPTFVEGGTVQAPYNASDPTSCDSPIQSEQGRPILVIADRLAGSGLNGLVGGGVFLHWSRGGSTILRSRAYVWADDVVTGISSGDDPDHNYDPSFWIAAHVMGHVLGFRHSGGEFGREDSAPYSNRTDFMSGGRGLMGTAAFHRYVAGWIANEDVVIYEQGSESFTLSPLGVEGEQMLVIPYHTGEPGVFYTLGARVARGYDEDNLPKDENNDSIEGVEVYLVDFRGKSSRGLSHRYEIRAAPVWPASFVGNDHSRHVLRWDETLQDGGSMNLGTVRVEVAGRVGDRFTVNVEQTEQPEVTVRWSDPVTIPEGTPDDGMGRSMGELIFSEPIRDSIKLEFTTQTGARLCAHPDLPPNTDWADGLADITSYGTKDKRGITWYKKHTRHQSISRGQTQVTFSSPGYFSPLPDHRVEPDETYCITVSDLPPGFRWDDPTRTVLPITIRNDDHKILARFSEPITVLEGDPTLKRYDVQWPSPEVDYKKVPNSHRYTYQSTLGAKIIFSEPIPAGPSLSPSLRYGDPTLNTYLLRVATLTGEDCAHPDLKNPVWADQYDVGLTPKKYRDIFMHDRIPTEDVYVFAGDQEVVIPVWWTADREHEPDETFCIVIPNLTR